MNWKRFSKISLVALVGFFSVAAVTKDHDKLFEISKNIEIFTNLYQEINTHYVDDLNPSKICLLYTSPSPRDRTRSRMPSSA